MNWSKEIMNWCLEPLKKYAVFNGRARRKEYWYFFLFNITISIVLTVIAGVIKAVIGSLMPEAVMGILDLLPFIYLLATLIPSIAVMVRRLHDTGHSGWWFFFGLLIPPIYLMVLVYMFQNGEPGRNRYGANPKEAAA